MIPNKEIPLKHVYVSVDATDDKLFECSFRVVHNQRFILSAKEIANRCRIHQQPVPYIVAAQLHDSRRYYLGDTLLVVEEKKRHKQRVLYLCGLELLNLPWIGHICRP